MIHPTDSHVAIDSVDHALQHLQHATHSLLDIIFLRLALEIRICSEYKIRRLSHVPFFPTAAHPQSSLAWFHYHTLAPTVQMPCKSCHSLEMMHLCSSRLATTPWTLPKHTSLLHWMPFELHPLPQWYLPYSRLCWRITNSDHFLVKHIISHIKFCYY